MNDSPSAAEIPLTLYVHLPWCVRKCPYCDFNSHRAGDAPPRDRYVDALVRDLQTESTRSDDRPLTSIFLGGGTPSLFDGAEIGRLLDAVAGLFPVLPDAEVTLEVNPGTVERGSFRDYHGAGVNRISLGAQSFDDASLAALGRIHTAADTRTAFEEARRAGIDNVNLDLMFGLPGQDLGRAIADVCSALELAPEHISHYQLTLEPNTRFFADPPTLPDADLAWEMQECCHGRLAEAGYRHYEVSAFARDGRECRHNLNYWRFGDYLAVGAGAHGKLTGRDGVVRRTAKPPSPRAYMESMLGEMPTVAASPVEGHDLAFEYLLNVLRLSEGFSMRDFQARTGLETAVIEPGLDDAIRRDLLEKLGGCRYRPTEHGRRFLNDLQSLFLPSRQAAVG